MNVLLVDDEPNILKTVTICLNAMNLNVVATRSPVEALEIISSSDQQFDIGFFDLKMFPMDGIELMMRVKAIVPELTVVIITAHGTVGTAVEAIKKGAFDYLQKPFDFDELRNFIQRVTQFHELKLENNKRRAEAEDGHINDRIVTRNPAMSAIVTLAERIADTPLPVLIEGESGTGKELFAQLVHNRSGRVRKPFIKVNCAALPENLLESELFGHVKGAFTGAVKDRIGRFEAAEGGTIFLDEIGEMPTLLQSKLLRVLQNHEYERLGESRSRKTDVRIIAATNRNIEQEIATGNFREDLFYRMNAVRMKVPPLRERREDIPLLILHFIDKHAPLDRKEISVSPEALDALIRYEWRGNVRELENVIQRAVFLAQMPEITVSDLPDEILPQTPFRGMATTSLTLEEIEKEHIAKILSETKTLDEAAKTLDIDAATLWRKRKKYNL